MTKNVLRRIAILFICILALDVFLINQLSKQEMNDQRVDVSLQLAALRARLEEEVTKNLLLIQGTANFIAISPDLSQQMFARYARGVLSEDNQLKNIAAAPDFVMRFVYPLECNREILGVDYRDLPDQWEQARKAMETGELVIAGPLELIQGGTGLIGRAPVYTEAQGEERFWGIVSSVIDVDTLFDNVGLYDYGLDIAIRGQNGKGSDGVVFFGYPHLFATDDVVQMPVTFPSGSWVLAAVPRGGWTGSHPLAYLVHALLALLLAVVSYGVYRTEKRNHTIRTIQQSLNHAQALAHLGSWRLDHSTGEIWWSDEIYRIFGVDKQSFFPTLDSFMGIVHPEDRQEVLKAFQLSTDACAGYAVDHRIVRPDGEIRHVQERGETVCLDGGDIPTHALGTVLDVTERTRAEEALRASEERWKFAIEGSRDGLWDWDATTDIVYFSPRWKHMLGYADHEIGTSLEEWDSRLHPDDRDRVFADLTPHLEGLTPYYENTHRVRCKDGTYKWILDRGKVIERDADGKPLRVIGTHTDVTEERQAQQELRVARDRLEMAQSLASIGSWEIDRATGSVHWSDEVFRIFGKDPRDGAPSVDDYTRFVHPADRDAFMAAMETAYRMGEPFSTEHRALLADGQVKHISAIGKVLYTDEGHSVGLMGTVQDITERKQAEETLRASEEKMRAMSEASYDALIVVDANDIVSFWSPAAERMFGWTKEEVIGQRLHPLITPVDYHHRVQKGLGTFAKTGRGPLIDSIQEMTAIRKTGEEFPVERSVTSFKLGDSYLAVGSLRDITERKRIEQELRNYADRLTLASKAGGIGVWEWNLQTNSLTWDDQMFQLYSVDLDDFIGIYEAWQSRLHPDDLEETEKALQRAIQSAGLWEFEFRVVWPNDEIRYIKAAALVKVDNNDDPELLIGVNWDVTDSKEQEERLRYMATTDDMTRLHNRRFFIEQVQREMERSQRYPSPFSLIMFDADRFKGVNDTYGHDVGDMVLKTIAKTARDVLRDVDILGRLGGEEFAVGLPETDMKGAMLVAERLRVAIEEAFVELPGGDRVDFTVSLGLAVLDDTCTDVDDLLKHADLALYRAKENGRNRVELYTESLG